MHKLCEIILQVLLAKFQFESISISQKRWNHLFWKMDAQLVRSFYVCIFRAIFTQPEISGYTCANFGQITWVFMKLGWN